MSRPVELQPVFLMYAFRYALGRMTYAVGDVGDALIVHRNALRSDWRYQIVRDIEEAIAEDRAGMPGDVEQWQRVARAMAS